MTVQHAPLLDATAVVKHYGRKRVLDGVSVSVHAGEAVAIVGENGAGKSTLLGVCTGLVRADAGTVTVRGRIGFCPQEPGLFELLSADEHLELFGSGLGLGRSTARSEGRRLLTELGFRAGEHAQCRHLSGGGRQKLNLALALLGAPPILLLDEPYQGFDHGAYVCFWQLVGRWKAEGMAVVVVTHFLTDDVHVDRVIELSIPPDQEAVK